MDNLLSATADLLETTPEFPLYEEEIEEETVHMASKAKILAYDYARPRYYLGIVWREAGKTIQNDELRS